MAAGCKSDTAIPLIAQLVLLVLHQLRCNKKA
jgi:hypothetical protein